MPLYFGSIPCGVYEQRLLWVYFEEGIHILHGDLGHQQIETCDRTKIDV